MDEYDELTEGYRGGKTVPELAFEFGRSEKAIRLLLERLDVELRPPGRASGAARAAQRARNDDPTRLASAYLEGYSVREIACFSGFRPREVVVKLWAEGLRASVGDHEAIESTVFLRRSGQFENFQDLARELALDVHRVEARCQRFAAGLRRRGRRSRGPP